MSAQEKIICEMLAKLLGCDPTRMTASTSLQDQLGIDSTEMVDIVCSLEQRFNVKLPAETATLKTIGDLGRIVTTSLMQSPA